VPTEHRTPYITVASPECANRHRKPRNTPLVSGEYTAASGGKEYEAGALVARMCEAAVRPRPWNPALRRRVLGANALQWLGLSAAPFEAAHGVSAAVPAAHPPRGPLGAEPTGVVSTGAAEAGVGSVIAEAQSGDAPPALASEEARAGAHGVGRDGAKAGDGSGSIAASGVDSHR